MNQCDSCVYNEYDEEYGDYYCSVDMEEDDYARLMSEEYDSCRYYRNGDEYAVVRHQM